MAMFGFPEELIPIGDPTTMVGGHGLVYAAGPGFHTNPGVGAHTTSADGIGGMVSAGTGSQREFGDLVGLAGTGVMITLAGHL